MRDVFMMIQTTRALLKPKIAAAPAIGKVKLGGEGI